MSTQRHRPRISAQEANRANLVFIQASGYILFYTLWIAVFVLMGTVRVILDAANLSDALNDFPHDAYHGLFLGLRSSARPWDLQASRTIILVLSLSAVALAAALVYRAATPPTVTTASLFKKSSYLRRGLGAMGSAKPSLVPDAEIPAAEMSNASWWTRWKRRCCGPRSIAPTPRLQITGRKGASSWAAAQVAREWHLYQVGLLLTCSLPFDLAFIWQPDGLMLIFFILIVVCRAQVWVWWRWSHELLVWWGPDCEAHRPRALAATTGARSGLCRTACITSALGSAWLLALAIGVLWLRDTPVLHTPGTHARRLSLHHADLVHGTSLLPAGWINATDPHPSARRRLQALVVVLGHDAMDDQPRNTAWPAGDDAFSTGAPWSNVTAGSELWIPLTARLAWHALLTGSPRHVHQLELGGRDTEHDGSIETTLATLTGQSRVLITNSAIQVLSTTQALARDWTQDMQFDANDQVVRIIYIPDATTLNATAVHAQISLAVSGLQTARVLARAPVPPAGDPSTLDNAQLLATLTPSTRDAWVMVDWRQPQSQGRWMISGAAAVANSTHVFANLWQPLATAPAWPLANAQVAQTLPELAQWIAGWTSAAAPMDTDTAIFGHTSPRPSVTSALYWTTRLHAERSWVHGWVWGTGRVGLAAATQSWWLAQADDPAAVIWPPWLALEHSVLREQSRRSDACLAWHIRHNHLAHLEHFNCSWDYLAEFFAVDRPAQQGLWRSPGGADARWQDTDWLRAAQAGRQMTYDTTQGLIDQAHTLETWRNMLWVWMGMLYAGLVLWGWWTWSPLLAPSASEWCLPRPRDLLALFCGCRCKRQELHPAKNLRPWLDWWSGEGTPGYARWKRRRELEQKARHQFVRRFVYLAQQRVAVAPSHLSGDSPGGKPRPGCCQRMRLRWKLYLSRRSMPSELDLDAYIEHRAEEATEKQQQTPPLSSSPPVPVHPPHPELDPLLPSMSTTDGLHTPPCISLLVLSTTCLARHPGHLN